MRSRFNMFPVVEGKETKANTIGKAAIIGGCILTFFGCRSLHLATLLPGKSTNSHPPSLQHNSRVRRCGVSEL